MNFKPVYEAICRWAKRRGIDIRHEALKRNKAGEFNGVSATMNTSYGTEERTYYLIHALGSMTRWSLSHDVVQQMFDELRMAKQDKDADPHRLERAIEKYRAFETESSEFAAWLFNELGHADIVPSYSNFMRADLEALTQFHRTGKAPVWQEFFDDWNRQVAQGSRQIEPFKPKEIPPFQPKQIELQEILQEQPK